MVALRKSDFAGGSAGEGELPPRDEIAAHFLSDETRLVGGLIERAVFTEDERRRTSDLARTLVEATRVGISKHGGVDAFMREYGLSSDEGVILMCLAEALLRIPDAETADRFIVHPKIPFIARWFVNAPDPNIWMTPPPASFVRWEGALVQPDDPIVRVDLLPGGESGPATPIAGGAQPAR